MTFKRDELFLLLLAAAVVAGFGLTIALGVCRHWARQRRQKQAQRQRVWFASRCVRLRRAGKFEELNGLLARERDEHGGW